MKIESRKAVRIIERPKAAGIAKGPPAPRADEFSTGKGKALRIAALKSGSRLEVRQQPTVTQALTAAEAVLQNQNVTSPNNAVGPLNPTMPVQVNTPQQVVYPAAVEALARPDDTFELGGAPSAGCFVGTSTPGTYVCAGCANPLFTSGQKFESGTGWPSFTAPIAPDAVTTRGDDSHGVFRADLPALPERWPRPPREGNATPAQGSRP